MKSISSFGMLTLFGMAYAEITYDENHDPEILIIFMFFGLILGALAMYLLSRFARGVPYTVVMFLVGAGLAGIVDNCNAGHLGESINSWKKLDPEMMLFLFLPVLVFGEAMTLKWHHLKGGLSQALLLAGPGVVIGAFIMGTFVFYLPLGWSWNLSMVFGSILAATDTVAVVALLKSAGASPKLTMLIIGESLFNDGTAMVLFTLFFDMLKGKHYDGGDVMLFFLKMAIGSPLFGALVGLVSVYVMSFLNKPLSSEDVTVQIAITICCAYMTFFMAEYECGMSGLLACCGAGSMFAWLSPPLILEHETMHHVWGIIEWTGNTLIFLLAGLIIGSKTIHIVTVNDWGYLILLYAFLQVLRGFVVAVLYPIVANVGLKCSRNDAVFLAWAGLRGAVGMALALIVQGNRSESDLSKHDTDRVFFFVGGIAALTLVINATTVRRVLELLGLLKHDTPDKVLVMDQIRKRLRHRLMNEVRHFQKDLHIADIDDIIKYNTLLQNEARDSIADKDESARLNSLSVGGIDRTLSRRTSNSPILSDLLMYVRTVFLEIVRVEYWHRIEDGRLPRQTSATQSLLYSIDNALDRVHKKRLRDWKWLKNEMGISPTLLWLASLLQKWSYPTSSLYSVLDVLEARNEELRVYILTNFIEAHEAAQKKIFRFMGEEDAEVDENFRTPETALVLSESQDSVHEAKRMLEEIDKRVINSIMCRQAGRSLLSKQVEFVTDMVREGLMAPQDTERFFDLVQKDLDRLDKSVNKDFTDHVKLTQSKRVTMSRFSMSVRYDLLSAVDDPAISALSEDLITSTNKVYESESDSEDSSRY